MNLKRIHYFFVVLLLFIVLSASSGIISKIKQKLQAAILPTLLVELTNEDRQVNNLSSLEVNPVLSEAAKMKADDMAKNGYFAHLSPEGKDLRHWLNEVNYDFLFAGENLAVKFSKTESVEKSWMESTSHRANILNENYSEIGIATAEGMYKGKKTTFVVQFFGTPKLAKESASSEIYITNISQSLNFDENNNIEETLFIAMENKDEEKLIFPSKSFIQGFYDKTVSNLKVYISAL